MSSQNYWPLIELNPAPARYLTGVMLVLAVGGVAGIYLLAWPIWITLAVAITTGLLLVRDLRRHALLQHPGAIRQLRWLPDGRWELVYMDGARAQVRLLPGSILLHGLQLLSFQLINKPAGWRQRSILLTPERISAAQNVQLRRRLTVAGLKVPEKA